MTPTKIGFVLLSNSGNPIPSTRVAVLNMFPYLREAQFDPHIVYEPAESDLTPDVSGLAPRLAAEGYRAVLFQKVRGPSTETLARELADHGIKTAYVVCDLVDVGMATATDATIVVTDYLKSLYPASLQHKLHVVHDGIEQPHAVKTETRTNRGSRMRPLRAVLVTSSGPDQLPVLRSPPPWLHVDIVGRYPRMLDFVGRMREARWKLATQQGADERLQYLRFLMNRRIHRLRWDAAKVYDALRRADIGIIPVTMHSNTEPGQPVPAWMVKSENRLTMKMSVGLPVIASPVPSYEAVIQQGRNGFLAHSRSEWLEHLSALRDPQCRQVVGEAARRSVALRYSMQEQARRLVDVLSDMVGRGRNKTSAAEVTQYANVVTKPFF